MEWVAGRAHVERQLGGRGCRDGVAQPADALDVHRHHVAGFEKHRRLAREPDTSLVANEMMRMPNAHR